MAKKIVELTQEEKDYRVLTANVREVAKSKAGKAFIWHLLGLANLYSESFTGNSSTFYNEGRRGFGLQILQLLDDADPTIYPRMILDNIEPKIEE